MPGAAPETPAIAPFGFTGALQQGDQVWLRARWYDALRGSFSRRDPFAGQAERPYSLMPYQYAYSSPSMWIDPTGECVGWIWGDPSCSFIGVENIRKGNFNWEDGRVWESAALDFLPVIGDIKGVIEAFTGCDLITGEDLGPWRWMGLMGLSELRHLKHLDEVVEARKLAKEAAEHVDDIAKEADDITDTAKKAAKECLNSFSADTLVATAAGLRPISEIRVGDLVWGYDASTQTTGLFTVTDVLIHSDPIQVQLTIDESLETTPEHPFFTAERGWVTAHDLRLGEHVRQLDGSIGVLRSLWVETEPQLMYNLTVAGAHTFFVGEERWLVHNSGVCREFAKKLNNGSEIIASMDQDNIFWTVIEVPEGLKGQGIGTALFTEACDPIGKNATANEI